jgi:hypothetical protein
VKNRHSTFAASRKKNTSKTIHKIQKNDGTIVKEQTTILEELEKKNN